MIERCIRQGVAYDLFWSMGNLDLAGYREIVRVREDGSVLIETGGKRQLREGPRVPARPDGTPPALAVEVLPKNRDVPVGFTARARVIEGSSPAHYTLGADERGRSHKVMVAWVLYGPDEQDYRFLHGEVDGPRNVQDGNGTLVEMKFRIDSPGKFDLRAATVDMSGRTSVVWKTTSVN